VSRRAGEKAREKVSQKATEKGRREGSGGKKIREMVSGDASARDPRGRGRGTQQCPRALGAS
jgi:hypothetical protein